MASVAVPDVLASLLLPEYSEQSLLDSLAQALSVNEEPFVLAFLQFVVDSAELELPVSGDMAFLVGVVRPVEAISFLPYRMQNVALAIESFLDAYVIRFKPYQIEMWRSKVLILLKALIDAGDHLSACGLYFVVNLLLRLLKETEPLSVNREILKRFRQDLLALYDFVLINNDNFSDVPQKLNVMFQLHWEQLLADKPTNVNHLTDLLYLNDSALKKSVLQTVTTILNSRSTENAAKDHILGELRLMKDILIAMCHKEPLGIPLLVMNILFQHESTVCPELCDKQNVFLLMISPKLEVREIAKSFFLRFLAEFPRDSQENLSHRFLSAVEELLRKFHDAWENVERLTDVLCDSFPPFVDIFVYIIGQESALMTQVCHHLIRQMVKRNTAQDDILVHVSPLALGALNELAAKQSWDVFEWVLPIFIDLPVQTLFKLTTDQLKALDDHLLGAIRKRDSSDAFKEKALDSWIHLQTNCQPRNVVEDWTNIFEGNWFALARLLDKNYLVDEHCDKLTEIIKDTIWRRPTDLMDVLDTLHLVVLRSADLQKILSGFTTIMEVFQRDFFDEEMHAKEPEKFTQVLRILVNLMFHLISNLDLQDDHISFFTQTEKTICGWIERWIRGNQSWKYNDWQKELTDFLEISTPLWVNVDTFSDILHGQMELTGTAPFATDFLGAMLKNIFYDKDVKVKQMELVLATTLIKLTKSNQVHRVPLLLGSVSKKLQEVLIERPKLFIRVLWELFKSVDSLFEPNTVSPNRLKCFEYVYDVMPSKISERTRQMILSKLEAIKESALTSAEKTTLQLLQDRLH